jgi:hypothetical protein
MDVRVDEQKNTYIERSAEVTALDANYNYSIDLCIILKYNIVEITNLYNKLFELYNNIDTNFCQITPKSSSSINADKISIINYKGNALKMILTNQTTNISQIIKITSQTKLEHIDWEFSESEIASHLIKQIQENKIIYLGCYEPSILESLTKDKEKINSINCINIDSHYYLLYKYV